MLRRKDLDVDGLRSAAIQVGSHERNVFSRSECVPSGKEDPADMDHLCLSVDAASVDALIAEVRQVAVDIVRDPVETRAGAAVFVHDLGGVRVELQLKKPTTA